MSDLLQSQIKESCKLLLPTGLKELMSDITREVLRAQPANLYDFITNYLAALLVTRENVTIGYHLCQEVCEACCRPPLEDELRNIGLDEENVAKAKEIIEKYFKQGNVNEANLMIKLMKKISISDYQVDLVQKAVHNAYLQHKIKKYAVTADSEIPEEEDDISRAVSHTMQLYAEAATAEEDGEENIQQASREQSAELYDISYGSSSQTDKSKSLSEMFYDPGKYNDTNESSKQRNMSDISEKLEKYNDTNESSKQRNMSDISEKLEKSHLPEHNQLRFNEDKEVIHMTPSNDTFSLKVRKAYLIKKTSNLTVDMGSDEEDDNDGGISSISEINFREFCEKSSNEAVFEACDFITPTSELHIGNVVVDKVGNDDYESNVPVKEMLKIRKSCSDNM